MSFFPLPPLLNYQDWKERYDKGYRTLEELDPEFAKWIKSNNRRQLCCLGLFVVCVLFVIFILWWF